MTAPIIATHPEKDFEVWKALFDKHEPMRKEGGERSAVVLQHTDDPNMVTVVNTWDSLEAAQAFLGQVASTKASIQWIPENAPKNCRGRI